MLCSTSLKRKAEVSFVSESIVQQQQLSLEAFETRKTTSDLIDSPLESIPESLFTFSPFGLCCRKCEKHVAIKLDERSIRNHLKKHGMDSRITTVRSLLHGYNMQLNIAKASGSIEQFRMDKNTYSGYSCICGPSFLRKANADRHCQTWGCNGTRLQKADLIKLSCGRYVSQSQVTSFFQGAEPSRIKQQFDYNEARAAILPFLPQGRSTMIRTLICSLHLFHVVAVSGSLLKSQN
ncbi:hypothetical protein MHU86_24767 [Fragilaria crotonensis]|nr:hypothetical protein MHU86_24767 [Fragilaria crotonensis]